ncbi:MAG: hypothetical protein WCC94_04515 [Candidatus Bathyarchaeia archaeon]
MPHLLLRMNWKAFTIIALAALALSMPVLAFAQPGGPGQGMRMHGDFEWYYSVKGVLSTVNLVLLVILLIIYLRVYSDTRSEFALGLIVFALAMMMYAITSNPWLQSGFGFRGSGLGPFAFFPDLFALVALVILLFFAVRYR